MIKDRDLKRGSVPMTKEKTRALTFFELGIREGDRFLDIGSGTGSISAQALELGAKVLAIDFSKEAVELTRENGESYGKDLEVILGRAPDDLPERTFDKVFIGGGSKDLEGIFEYIDKSLVSGGTIVANFILISSLNKALEEMKKRGYKDIRASLSQLANMNPQGLFIGENPIYIVSAKKG